MRLLLIFVLVPVIEIALFIQIGGLIGVFPTIAIVIGTALIGTSMLRAQGGAVLDKLQGALAAQQDPSAPIAEGAMLLFAAALLLTPGFFTDTIGFLLLIPGIRQRLFVELRKAFAGNLRRASQHSHPAFRSQPEIMEGEYQDLDQGTAQRRNPEE